MQYDPILNMRHPRPNPFEGWKQVMAHGRMVRVRIDARDDENTYRGTVEPRLPGGPTREKLFRMDWMSRFYMSNYEKFLTVTLFPCDQRISTTQMCTTRDVPRKMTDKIWIVRHTVAAICVDVTQLLDERIEELLHLNSPFTGKANTND